MPTRRARTAISVVAGWLLGVGAASAQTLPPLPEIVLPPMEAQPTKAETPRIQTVTFTRPPVSQVQSAVEAVAAQQVQPAPAKVGMDTDADGFVIHIELPGFDRQFQRWSEDQFFDALRLEARTRLGAQRVFFPERVPVSREKYAGRNFKQGVVAVEPSFVVHRKLLFEQKNFDRHGWELGALQPGVSTARFFYDVVALPYHTWTHPLRHWDSSAGKVLPGDDMPLLFNREPFSITGLLGQSGAVALGMVAFP